MPKPSTIHPPVTHPPLQARSREKLERVLVACEALLETQLFEEITMAELARRARVAVGTLYTRFKSKDDLLPALFARHDAAVAQRVERLMGSLAQEPSLKARIQTLVDFAVDYHRTHRGLLRALTMFVRAHGQSLPAKAWRKRAGQYRAVAQVVLGDGKGFRPGDPLEATEFALGIINSVCREQVLFDEVTPLRGHTDLGTLKRRLAHMIQRDLMATSI